MKEDKLNTNDWGYPYLNKDYAILCDTNFGPFFGKLAKAAHWENSYLIYFQIEWDMIMVTVIIIIIIISFVLPP